MDQSHQTGNNLPSQILDNNVQYTSIYNIGMPNTDAAVPVLQNTTFGFYLPLPNDTRIYYVACIELNSLEIAQLLNNSSINSRTSDYQLPHHHNVGMDQRINTTATSVPQNTTFEFYLSNDTSTYYVTYIELNSSEIARLLNNNINLSHIPDFQLQHHRDIQSSIHQQIRKQTQRPVHEQNTIQPFNTMIMTTTQAYSDNVNNNAVSNLSDGTIPDYMQDTGYDTQINN